MPFIRTKDGSISIIRKAEVFSNNTVHIKKCESHDDPRSLLYKEQHNHPSQPAGQFYWVPNRDKTKFQCRLMLIFNADLEIIVIALKIYLKMFFLKLAVEFSCFRINQLLVVRTVETLKIRGK